jgi:hypothetical protein
MSEPSKLRVVYAAESSLDAHLVKGLLEQRGVPVRIVGHHLEGGIGELPAGGLVHLLVPEDWVETARGVIEDYEARRAGDAPGEGDAVWAECTAGTTHAGEGEEAEAPAAWGLGTRDWLLITAALALIVLLLFGGAR